MQQRSMGVYMVVARVSSAIFPGSRRVVGRIVHMRVLAAFDCELQLRAVNGLRDQQINRALQPSTRIYGALVD